MSSFCKFNEIGCTSRIRKRTIEVESPSRVFYPSSCGIKQVGGGIFGGEWTSISWLCAAPFSTGLFPFLSLSLSLSLAAVPLLHLPFFFSSQKSSKRQYQTRPIREAYFLFFFVFPSLAHSPVLLGQNYPRDHARLSPIYFW